MHRNQRSIRKLTTSVQRYEVAPPNLVRNTKPSALISSLAPNKRTRISVHRPNTPAERALQGQMIQVTCAIPLIATATPANAPQIPTMNMVVVTSHHQSTFEGLPISTVDGLVSMAFRRERFHQCR